MDFRVFMQIFGRIFGMIGKRFGRAFRRISRGVNFGVLIRVFRRVFGTNFGTIGRRVGRVFGRIFRGTFGRTVGVGGTFGSGLEVSGKQPGGGNRVRSGNGSIGREVGSGCGRRGTCRLMSGESHQGCTYASIV
jgi:hypothetical protein